MNTLTLLFNNEVLCTTEDTAFAVDFAIEHKDVTIQTPEATSIDISVYAGDRLISRTDINHAVQMATIEGVHIVCEM